MLLSLVYFAVRRLLRLLSKGSERDDLAREIEILVLRHQLRVLARGKRMPLRRRDRLLLEAASGLLGRDRWCSLPVSRRRCCAGIASWCAASGPTGAGGGQAGREQAASQPR